MNWAVLVRERVKKHIARLSKKEQARMSRALFELGRNPYSGDLVKLEGEDNLWRRRIGVYRIKFHIEQERRVVYVYAVERRSSHTY